MAKELDAVVKQTKADSHSFVAFLVDDPAGIRPKLKDLAAKNSLTIPLTIPVKGQGVQNFKLAPDAWVTVLFYQGKKAGQTLSWPKEKFDAAAVAAIIAEAKKQAKLSA